MLVLRDVEKAFGKVRALRDVCLDVPRGQMLGVIGRSGAGKSTLLRTINRLGDPSAGAIRFDGVDVTGLAGRELMAWRGRCAMIFQQFNLVGRLDVISNVLLGRLARTGRLASLLGHFSDEDRARAILALERLDMAHAALQRADTLSGGQQQRVAIARALVQEPDILLADEPIASLDPRSAQLVMEALRRINREDGITVIANLHTLDTARAYCDRIVGMREGRIVFDGRPDELTVERARELYGSDGLEEMLAETVTSTALPARLARVAA
ncbi:phosphonate ABC transporter ATP-binding protein [Geminicoccus flavidas]|uniref:phosphonate ABC transporter ATP-binding protein n=1 Tax=Geminicoccus flavidas TaxID=2506407 RepID=UPI001356AEB7|nr:phosphonate ABC transporter ATP-binding protein [Geminicoccus flavidas]